VLGLRLLEPVVGFRQSLANEYLCRPTYFIDVPSPSPQVNIFSHPKNIQNPSLPDMQKTEKNTVTVDRDLLNEDVELLPEQVIKNVEVINTHHQQHRQNTTTDRRILDKIAGFLGRPQFLYAQIVFFAVWIGCTNLADRKIIPKNFPLFDLHLHGLEVASLLISTEVLIYQNREEKLSEERSHLMLQFNMVTEQKITKLISLVEELRTDLPNVQNRHDLEAEMMKQATDPQAILEVLQHNAAAESRSVTEAKRESVGT
jgi:uncharacterized membrane protein